jgi:dihydroorotate dehydrogenase electron transfer subunit
VGPPTGKPPYRVIAPVAESVRLSGDHHRLVLRDPSVAEAAEPGQFLHLWVHSPEDIERPPSAAVLRRPYSISDVVSPDRVEIMLRVRGTGGRILAAKREGDRIDLIGPLGRGFRIRPGLRCAIVAAGGIGLAPVPFLVRVLASSVGRVVLLAGAGHDDAVPYSVSRSVPGRATIPELEALGADVTFVSEAVEGILITQVVEARLGEFTGDDVEMFAVGPRAMLKRLAEITEGCLPLQVSLEERMACGLGACRSCVVPVRAGNPPGYKTVCRDGPVFCSSEIDWGRLEP